MISQCRLLVTYASIANQILALSFVGRKVKYTTVKSFAVTSLYGA